MKNVELLLMGGSKLQKTHAITCGRAYSSSGKITIHVVGFTSDTAMGSLSPNTISGYTITALGSNPTDISTNIQLDLSSPTSAVVRVTRLDTMQSVDLIFDDTLTGLSYHPYTIEGTSLFTDADENKTIELCIELL